MAQARIDLASASIEPPWRRVSNDKRAHMVLTWLKVSWPLVLNIAADIR
jgi:hypothetical protein